VKTLSRTIRTDENAGVTESHLSPPDTRACARRPRPEFRLYLLGGNPPAVLCCSIPTIIERLLSDPGVGFLPSVRQWLVTYH